MSKKFSYDSAMAELNNIVTAIQSEEVGLDQLSEMIKKAKSLIDQCRTKLREVDKEIEDLTENEAEG